MKKEIKPWQEISRSSLAKTRVFDLMVSRMRSPDGSHEDDFYSLDTFDWVNIIPLTADQEVVLVRQFRHGTREALLETPGGIIDEKHGGNPEQAARTELREETGREATRLIQLGWNHPNPAIQSNRCFFYLAENVAVVGEQQLDEAEDISVELYPLVDVPDLIAAGEISHSLSISAFFYLALSEYTNFTLSAP